MTQTSFGEISEKRDPLTTYINHIASYYERGIANISNDVRDTRLFNTERTTIATGPTNLSFADILSGFIEIPSGGTDIITIPTGDLTSDDIILLEKKIGSVFIGTGIMTYIRNTDSSNSKTIQGSSTDFIGTNSIELESSSPGTNDSLCILFTKIISGNSTGVATPKYTLYGPFSP